MYLETVERALAGTEKFILPAGMVKGDIRYWEGGPGRLPGKKAPSGKRGESR